MLARSSSQLPHGRPLWSLLEDVLVEPAAGGHLAVRGRWGEIEVADRSDLVRDALNRMSLGPVSLENVPPLHENFVSWRDGSFTTCAHWRRLKRTLDQLGGYVVASLGHEDGSGPLVSAIAVAPDVVFTWPTVRETEPIHPWPDTTIETINAEQALVRPGAPYQVVLHRSPAQVIAKALLDAPASVADLAGALDLDRPLVADIVGYLIGAGVVAPVRH